jgi:erythromycin esterase
MKHLVALGFALAALAAQNPDPAKPRPAEVSPGVAGHRIQGSVSPILEGMRLSFTKQVQDDEEDVRVDVDRGRFSVVLPPGCYSVRAIAKDRGYPGIPLIVRGDMQNVMLAFQPDVSAAPAGVQAWIRSNAIPLQSVVAGSGFTDLQPLKALVGTATVVGLGEATHGTKEFFQLKHRMLEFLVEEMGFRVFAIEANLPEAYAVDEYIRTGQGDPAKALKGLYFWTWDTREVLDQILWMRQYNADPSHTKKLRFYGVDMQEHRVALAQAKAWLEKVAPEEAGRLDAIGKRIAMRMEKGESRSFSKSLKQSLKVAAGFSEPASADWEGIARDTEALALRLDGRKASLAVGDQAPIFEHQRQNLRVLVQRARLEADPQRSFAVRDDAMAANLRWIQAQEPGEKIVLWAHNFHIGTDPRLRSMGWHLRKALGEAYLPIGFTFREGGFQAQNTDPAKPGLKVFNVTPPVEADLDAALAAAGHPAMALDLRRLPAGSVRDWFEAPKGTLGCGALFHTPVDPRLYVPNLPVSSRFGALFFINRTTPAMPVPETLPTQKPTNLGFEAGEIGKLPTGWSVGGGQGYLAQTEREAAKEGGRYLKVVFQGDPKAWVPFSAMQHLDATPYRGRKLRVSAWIRAEGEQNCQASLRVWVSREKGRSFLDDTRGRQKIDKTWTKVAIECTVAEDATALSLFCFVAGAGTACFDDIRIEVL